MTEDQCLPRPNVSSRLDGLLLFLFSPSQNDISPASGRREGHDPRPSRTGIHRPRAHGCGWSLPKLFCSSSSSRPASMAPPPLILGSTHSPPIKAASRSGRDRPIARLSRMGWCLGWCRLQVGDEGSGGEERAGRGMGVKRVGDGARLSPGR